MSFLSFAEVFFFEIIYSKTSFMKKYKSAKQFGSRSGPTWPGQDPNCLQRLSADDTRSKELNVVANYERNKHAFSDVCNYRPANVQ